ncbi:hypothetical protein MVEN_00404600 [Mycena venus]|uniref:DUF2470 domain-containing protein n=1 Tax=Mycena venus TaxID=2733690 RepID=A0A8H6YV14_9AGAR|nr:hypothetical protein MVEN_00404600 [Mycena venus]
MSDPVAANADLLKTWVSPAALASIAKWYAKAGEVATAEMVSIDSKNMTLNCRFVGISHKTVVVAFKPRLASYEDAQDRLLEMKAISQEGLGKTKPPKISSFRLQSTGIPDGIFIFTLFPYLMFSPPHGGSRFFHPAQLVQSRVDGKYIGMAFAAGVGWHALNTLYTWTLCWKHSIPFGATVAYTGMTMFTGFHTWVDLRKRIREARIDAARKSA